MKTSMAYRLFRLYFNSNSDNHQVFGNRVYNPLNGQARNKDQHLAALIRVFLILLVLSALIAVAIL